MKRLLRATLFMLKIFVLTKSRDYMLNVSRSILQLLYLSNSNHPIFEHLNSYPGLMDEEALEISLAQLTRMQPSMQLKASLEQTNNTYKLLPHVAHVAQTVDSYVNHASESGYMKIKDSSPDLIATREFFRHLIRRIRAKQFKYYGGNWKEWTSHAAAQTQLTDARSDPYVRTGTVSELNSVFLTISNSYGRRWMNDAYISHFPELKIRHSEAKSVNAGGISDSFAIDEPEEDWSSPDAAGPDLPPLLSIEEAELRRRAGNPGSLHQSMPAKVARSGGANPKGRKRQTLEKEAKEAKKKLQAGPRRRLLQPIVDGAQRGNPAPPITSAIEGAPTTTDRRARRSVALPRGFFSAAKGCGLSV